MDGTVHGTATWLPVLQTDGENNGFLEHKQLNYLPWSIKLALHMAPHSIVVVAVTILLWSFTAFSLSIPATCLDKTKIILINLLFQPCN